MKNIVVFRKYKKKYIFLKKYGFCILYIPVINTGCYETRKNKPKGVIVTIIMFNKVHIFSSFNILSLTIYIHNNNNRLQQYFFLWKLKREMLVLRLLRRRFFFCFISNEYVPKLIVYYIFLWFDLLYRREFFLKCMIFSDHFYFRLRKCSMDVCLPVHLLYRNVFDFYWRQLYVYYIKIF